MSSHQPQNRKPDWPNDSLFTTQKRTLLSEAELYDVLRQASPSRLVFFGILRRLKFDKHLLTYLWYRTDWQKTCKKTPKVKSDFCDRSPTKIFDPFGLEKPRTKSSKAQSSTMKSLIQLLIVLFIGSILFRPSRPHGLHEAEDKAHLKSHLHGSVDESHLDAMSVEELRFNYFKAHDADGNNKLDGCELTQAFVDYHAEEISSDPKMFSDKEIELVIDQILGAEDRNSDGYVDYTEFVASQERLDAHH